MASSGILMPDPISLLRESLLRGMQISAQGSYARRSPSRNAVPHLEFARNGLRLIVEQDADNVEALRLLAQAEECLLNYRQAVACLEQAMSLGVSRSKRDLKRLALLKLALAEWESLPVSPDQLRELGEFLEGAGVADESRGRSLEFTRQWLRNQGIAT